MSCRQPPFLAYLVDSSSDMIHVLNYSLSCIPSPRSPFRSRNSRLPSTPLEWVCMSLLFFFFTYILYKTSRNIITRTTIKAFSPPRNRDHAAAMARFGWSNRLRHVCMNDLSLPSISTCVRAYSCVYVYVGSCNNARSFCIRYLLTYGCQAPSLRSALRAFRRRRASWQAT